MREASRKRGGRHAHRDSTLLLIYRHGLRVKRETPSTQPIGGEELRSLRRLQCEYPTSPFVFQSSRKGPLANDSIAGIVELAGELAGLPFPTHPYMLRHGTGYYLANKGVDKRTIQVYLGHRNIQHTVRYTELAPGRFKGLWED